MSSYITAPKQNDGGFVPVLVERISATSQWPQIPGLFVECSKAQRLP
ncbi:hypothetical protein [Prochlorococcus sp. MIT 1306]|nr:hypothetical protein [Prochlorococcus sp. MIT 1306]